MDKKSKEMLKYLAEPRSLSKFENKEDELSTRFSINRKNLIES